MGRQIIRVAKDDPRYLVWNTVVGMPIMFGDRKETLHYLIEDYAKGTERRKFEKQDAKRRLDLADEFGGDAHRPFLVDWDPEAGKIYLQEGFLRRKNFGAWIERMESAIDADSGVTWHSVDVTDLLEPFEDD